MGINNQIEAEKKTIKQCKERLRREFESPPPVRELRPEYIKQSNVISIFESFLTRTLHMKTNELSDALIIVRVYFFEVFRDIVLNGFNLNGEHYVVFTASAGQIRTKKCVFIKESLLRQHERTLMCGLTVEHINACGGCNPNKYLAYLALTNTATDEWGAFNIDKSIVVDDMETLVHGTVDYIDDKTYQITRQEMDIPITHTDGCGMILPQLTGGKNMMVRLPWVKGLLAAFPYDDFIMEHPDWNYGLINDIYGKEHDVVAEGIEVIFTKSQFKMWKYYDSWEQYKDYFKRFGCAAGVCNVEADVIGNATINYQMLQTLTDFSDDELRKVAAHTKYKLEHISNDRKTMLKCLGATRSNPFLTPAQEALMLYPELLQDEYYREELRCLKKSLETGAWAGKLDIYAKYLFLVPDLYAYCQFLFLGDKNPRGLLADGEVYAAQFQNSEKLDCLRSPSLYREHPVRKNVVDNDMCQKWFGRNGLYTSCHDLISKVLQFDVDGDKSLVVADKTLIDVAERNMQGIVPLYYEMRKAAATPLTCESICDGMTAAYTGGNIGPISNSITKIWNDSEPDLDSIKRLCYKNNEVIDFAKVLYKSTPPKDVATTLSKLTNVKLPHFFIYAKGKLPHQVLERGSNPVDRLMDVIPQYRFNFGLNKGGRFDFHMLMNNPNLIRTPDVDQLIATYLEKVSKIKIPDRTDIYEDDVDTHSYQFWTFRNEMLEMRYNPNYVVDAIIYGIFHLRKAKHKKAFWGAFGDIVLENLKQNLAKQCDSMTLCNKCYARFYPSDETQLCPHCGNRNNKARVSFCIDCGEQFHVDPRNMSKTRCDRCYSIYRRNYNSNMMRKTRTL